MADDTFRPGDPAAAEIETLIRRGRDGDAAAMEGLYNLYKRRIFALAYRHTGNAAAAEDLLQDIFVKIFTHLGEVRDTATFTAWVYRIAANTCFSWHRRMKAQAGTVSLTALDGAIPEEPAEAGESSGDLRRPLEEAVRSLPAGLRNIFVLHDVQGYKHEEIARMLGCSAGTSKSQLFKARLRLRDILREKRLFTGESR